MLKLRYLIVFEKYAHFEFDVGSKFQTPGGASHR